MRQPPVSAHDRGWLLPFFLLSWLHMLFMTYPYFDAAYEGRLLSANAVFHLGAWPFYAMLYLLPAAAPVFITGRLFPRNGHVAHFLAVLLTATVLTGLWADRLIFGLYAFHINGFVLNLATTNGGIESLNSNGGTFLSIGLVIARIIAIQVVCLLIAVRYRRAGFMAHLKPAGVTTFFLALFLLQGSSYGIGDLRNDPAILEHAYDYPFFQKIRFRTFAGKLGFAAADRIHAMPVPDASRLHYPLAEVAYRQVDNPPNIVWLVAESLRWDQLDEELMPNTWQFAERSQHFLNHYSSGNGTREGMFGMFYGLYGSYWDSFLHARRSPLVMDRMQALGYRFDIRTGARFTYPEFDKTILARLPYSAFHEADDNLSPWQRDEANTTAMIDFLEQAHDGPFMTFQFFESTHAPYFFPAEAALRIPYQESLDYTEFSKDYLAENVGGILNRYRNAGYWVDRQVGRILETLAANDMLANTIVIITGDHGEEFMEKGSWGHNSSFVEEQTHVPFVLWIPGEEPQRVERLTSHLDIATTLLERLGADPGDASYSLGMNLLDGQPRDSIIISDWHSIAVVTSDMKIRIPYISTGFDNWAPTDASDHSLSAQRSRQLINRYQRAITRTLENTSLFTRSYP